MPRGKSRGLVGFAAMAGSVVGAVLQLQQAMLWGASAYAGMVTLAIAGWLVSSMNRWLARGARSLALALLRGALA